MSRDAVQIIDCHRDRAVTYGVLSRLFAKEVDEGLLEVLSKGLFPEEDDEPAAEGVRLMNGWLSGVDDESLTELSVDFARLFIIRTRTTTRAPYPFESVYTSSNHATMGESRDKVLSLYRKAGLARSESWNLGEDHIALELEYMCVLAGRCADALEEGDESTYQALVADQRFFVLTHLLNWVPSFAEEMKRVAQTDFYRGLAFYLEDFLESDRSILESM